MTDNYNGYDNYETWNVCLWLMNDESLYGLTQCVDDYEEFCEAIGYGVGGMNKTRDGVDFKDIRLNVSEINDMVFTD